MIFIIEMLLSLAISSRTMTSHAFLFDLGVKLSDVYNAVYSNISKNKPEIKDKFVKNIG